MRFDQQPFQARWQALISDRDRLVLFAPIEHGKSSQISVARTLWELGQDLNLRIAIISNTAHQAKKFLGEIKAHIQSNPRLRDVFPHLRPARGRGGYSLWTDSAIIVRRSMVQKDPSIIALGVGGGLLGARLDLVILDDVLDFANTLTESPRQKIRDWFASTVMGRVVEGGKIVVIGTAWHPEDLAHHLAANPAYHVHVDRSFDEQGNWLRLYPSRWPLQRLMRRKEEMGSLEFERQFNNVAVSEATQVFKRSWIERCLALSEGMRWAREYSGQWPIFTGVDLAVKRGETHDFTCLFTIALDEQGTLHVLDIWAERMELPQILEAILSVHRRYRPRTILVESNAAQAYVKQALDERIAAGAAPSDICVRPFTTGRQKMDPLLGVRAMTTLFENAKWRMPPEEPEVKRWIQGLINYSPGDHTDDRVMASWLAWQASRTVQAPVWASSGRER